MKFIPFFVFFLLQQYEVVVGYTVHGDGRLIEPLLLKPSRARDVLSYLDYEGMQGPGFLTHSLLCHLVEVYRIGDITKECP